MNKLTIIPAAIYAVLALVGCAKDNAASSGRIRCVVSQSTLTKAVETDLSALKNTGFTMLGIIDEDAKDYDSGSTIPAGTYINNEDVTCEGSNWSINNAPNWIENVTMRFWCWTPSSGLAISSTDSTLIGSTLIGSDELQFTYETSDGGGSDILLSYNSCKKTGSYSKEINFWFYHPLTNIRFCVIPTTGTPEDGEFKASYEIVSIALQDINNSASCTMTGRPYTSEAVAPSFTWANQAGSATCTQTYNAKFLDGSNNLQIPDSDKWTSKVLNGKTVYTAKEGFFIIPQSIGAETSLAVTFKRDATTFTKSVKLYGEGTSVWEPGKYYTYCISFSNDIIVTLLSSMDIEEESEW